MEYADHANYASSTACFGIEGNSGSTLSQVRIGTRTPAIGSGKTFPEQAVITLKPADQWGNCYTAHNGGSLNYMQYQRHLDFSKGLSLEIYKDDKIERIGVKFIEVTVIRSN